MAGKPVVKAKKPRAKKGANGYKLMESVVSPGTVLEDLAKEKWIIGPPIGQGGFGVIYSAKKAEENSASYRYVIKFEPHENGPLFVERNFYLKIAQKTDIDAWVKSNKLTHLGLPRYWGSGSHEVGSVKYRFLVTDRFGTDLWTKFKENDSRFPLPAAIRVALQTLNVLEYIHSTGYTHGDIKAANLVLGMDAATKNNVYLIDFGLVTKAIVTGEYAPNPKMAHNGSIEYVSTDAHDGVPSFRGDLECLGLNLLHWLAGTLPWEKVATSSVKGKEVQVQQLKKQFMSNLPGSLKTLNLDKPTQDILAKYLKYVASISHTEKPNYKVVRTMLQQALKEAKGSDKGPLEFSKPEGKAVKKSSRAVSSDQEAESKPKRAAPKDRGAKKVVASPTESSEEEMEVDEAPKPKRKVAKPRAKKVVQSPTDSEDELEEEAPKRKMAKPRAKKVVQPPSESSEEEMEVDEPHKNGKTGRGAAKPGRSAAAVLSSSESDEPDVATAPKKKRGGTKKEKEETVPLWKQSQTAQASGVVRPGEYARQQPDSKPRNTKKASK